MKALVMEIKNREMIVMTDDGQFLARPLAQEKIRIGDEIIVTELIAHKKIFTGWMAAAVLFITLLAGSWWWQVPVTPVLGAAVSYVSLDINPSVELGVDEQDQVVSWEGLNDDGRKILAGLNLSGWKSDDAVAALIESAVQAGYLNPDQGNEIILNVSTAENSKEKKDNQEHRLAAVAAKTLAAQKLVTRVSVLETSLELRDDARELGISAAKYAIFLEAESAGLDLELEQVKEIGVVKAIKDAGGNPGQVISQAKQEKAFAQKILQWKEKQQRIQEQEDNGGPEKIEEQENPGEQGKTDEPAPGSDAGGKAPTVNGQHGKSVSPPETESKSQLKETVPQKTSNSKAAPQIGKNQQSNQAQRAVITADSPVKKQRALLWLRDKIKAEFRGNSGSKAVK